MLTPTSQLLKNAQQGKYAIGAFNVYDLQGTQAVISAAKELKSPVMLQIHPKALEMGGKPLVALCIEAARSAGVPVSVHLDHSSAEQAIRSAVAAGMSSVMADGSHLSYDGNIAFTKQMSEFAHANGCAVEAELGRLSGTEDGLTVSEYEALLTDPDQANDFVTQTNIDALAMCIGNVHGKYPSTPKLDFERLKEIRKRVNIPLVLHGTSGLPDEMIVRSINLGVCKFNVNTEVREAYLSAIKSYLSETNKTELTDMMTASVQAMQAQVTSKIRLFGSGGKA